MKRRLHHHMDCPGVQRPKIPFLTRPGQPKMLVVPAGLEVNNATAGRGHPLPGEDPHAAARRRLDAGLGVRPTSLAEAGTVVYHVDDPVSGLVESEYNHLFVGWVATEPRATSSSWAAIFRCGSSSAPSSLFHFCATARRRVA